MTSTGPMGDTEVQRQQAPEIPDKLYFRIGEVSRLVGVKPHVLRYWESEFTGIAPKKSGTGHRLYRRKDVELLLEIKHLLHEKRFTIEGARRHLDMKSKFGRRQPASKTDQQGNLFGSPIPALDDVRRELNSILEMLK